MHDPAVFGSEEVHTAVITHSGCIVAVSASWEHFTSESPAAGDTPPRPCGVGSDYLALCRQNAEASVPLAVAIHAGVVAVLNGKSPHFSLEYPRHSPAGKQWFLMTVTALNQECPWAVITHLDITSRKRMQEQLQESEAQFQALFDHCPDGALVVDAEKKNILFSNESMCQMLGYRPEELCQLNVAALHPEAELPRIMAEFRSLAQNNRHSAKSVAVRRKDGTVFEVDISASRFPMGNRPCIVRLFRDTTERHESERRSRIQHDLMQALASANRLEDGLRLCLATAIKADGLDSGGFYLFDRERKTLILCVHQGLAPEFVSAVSRLDRGSPQFSLFAGGKPVYFTFEEMQAIPAKAELREGLRSIAVIPILNQGQLVGCMNIASHTHQVIPQSARIALETIAAGAGQAIARLHAQEALREGEANFRTFFQTMNDLIVVATTEGKIQFSNAAIETKLGFTAEELVGMSVLDLHPEAMRTEASEILAAMLRGERQTCPLPLARKDGRTLPVETRAWFGQWNGQPCLFGVCQDLSGEQEARRLINEKEARYQSLFDQAADGIMLLSSDGRIIDVNNAFARMHGYDSPKALEGLRLEDLDTPASTPLAAERVRRVAAGEAQTFEVEHFRKDGSTFPVSVAANRVSLGGEWYLQSFHRDITQQKQWEEKLAAEATRRRILIEGSRDGIVILDHQGKVFEANRRFGEMLGYTAEEFEHLHVWDWDRDWPRERVLEAIRTIGPAGAFFESRHWRKNGSFFDVELSNSSAELEGQKLVFCVCRDITERKQAESLLRESLIFRREAEKIGRIGAWKASPESDYLYWSEGVYEIVGAPLDYKPGLQEGLKFYDPASIPALQAALQATLRDGTPFAIEAGLTSLTGRHTWVEVRGLGRLEDGGQAFITGTLQDISERKEAEAQAARDACRTEFLLDLHQRAPLLTDQELYDQVLEQAVRLTGSSIGFFHRVSADQLSVILTTWNHEARKTCTAAFDAHYPLQEAGNWADCVREQQPLVYNNYAQSPNQHGLPEGHAPVHRLMSIPVIRDGKVSIVFGVGNKATDYDDHDVAQLQMVANEVHKIMGQRAAQKQLHESERRLGNLMANLPGMAYRCQNLPDWPMEFTSEGAAALTGYSLTQLMNNQPAYGELIVPSDRQSVWDTVQEGVARHRPFELNYQIRTAEGRVKWVWERGSGVFSQEGELLFLEGFITDISERINLETQVRQTQKMDAIGQLAGGVAHDFNNILAAMMMQLGLFQLESNLDPETSQVVKELTAEARRAASLTRQLLMFSRRSVLEIKPLDLNEAVKNLLKMLSRLIGENIKLIFDGYTGFLPPVAADTGLLEQVVMNLVVNARDAMPKGGRITLGTSVELLGEPEITFNPARQPGCFVCLTVSDTGMGMDEKTLSRIFEPFFTTKEPGKGTGLGLATVDGIIAQHKGWVEVRSKVGQGTTFRVFLPAVAEPVPLPTEETQIKHLHRGSETILLVEDEPRVRQGVSRNLRRLGYRLHEAEHGQQAMLLWQEHGSNVDLLLTDMVLPEGMTGLELGERLLSLKPTLKVIISSGYSSDIVQSGRICQPGISFLPKPYSTQTLAETIRACLDSGKK
jgi:PAS domain S-box-containing protein